VHEYRAGKADWLASGLATEGPGSHTQRIGAYVRRDVPTCRLDENVSDVAARAAAAGWDLCLVVNERNILLGRLNSEELQGSGEETIAHAMRPGPSTYRPDVAVAELRRLMADKGIGRLPVTTSEGLLLGVICREALELAVAEPGTVDVAATRESS